MTANDIISAIEAYAPPYLQESYDNTGLQVGDPEGPVGGVLVCMDVTEAILDEALERGCNMVVSHHPLLFHGVKCVAGRNRPERVLAKACAMGITVYSTHTAMDSAPGGVSWRMARMMGLEDVHTLVPQPAHPGAGLGVVGNLPDGEALTPEEFARRVKAVFGTPTLRLSHWPEGLRISRVALCGGSAAEFLPEAIAAGAQAYVTADAKLNQFLDHVHRILLVDAGHFETEVCTKEIICEILSEKFPNFAVCKSEKETNPIIYL